MSTTREENHYNLLFCGHGTALQDLGDILNTLREVKSTVFHDPN